MREPATVSARPPSVQSPRGIPSRLHPGRDGRGHCRRVPARVDRAAAGGPDDPAVPGEPGHHLQLAADLESVFSIAARQRRPIRISCCTAAGYTFADRSDGTVRLQRSLVDYGVTTLAFTASPVDIFPSGVASSADTVTIGAAGYTRRIVMSVGRTGADPPMTPSPPVDRRLHHGGDPGLPCYPVVRGDGPRSTHLPGVPHQSRVRSTATYRTAALTQEVERLGVIPFDSVIVGSSCTTVSAGAFPHSLCTTVTSISTVSRQGDCDRDADRRTNTSARHGRPGPHRPAPRRAAEHPVSPVSRSFSRGFTLVEMLISMIVLAIVGAGLVQMVMSQGRFMDHQEAWRRLARRRPQQPQPAVSRSAERRGGGWRGGSGGRRHGLHPARPICLRHHVRHQRHDHHAEPPAGGLGDVRCSGVLGLRLAGRDRGLQVCDGRRESSALRGPARASRPTLRRYRPSTARRRGRR